MRSAKRKFNPTWPSADKLHKKKYNSDFFNMRKVAFASGELRRASEKKCSLCRTIKPAHKFYLSSTNRDGLHGWCKECSDRRTVENGHKRLHGITPDDYKNMLAKQNGLCAICRLDRPTAGKKKFCVDHDHLTGTVRGLLCTRCNTMIGNALDSIEVLKSAISYLEGNR